MTEDELDLLASAYLDGEATSEEVAMVERDPELLLRVETMRAISGQIASVPEPPPALKEQHLAAAMAAFDAAPDLGIVGTEDGEAEGKPAENVLDFKTRAQAKETEDRMNRVRPVGIGGLPAWMPAAAVFILISGGIIALISTSGGNDDFDTATASETESGEDSAESADFTTEAGDSDTGAAALAESATVMEDDEAMADEEDAMESDDAMEEEAAMDESADAAEAAPTTTARAGGGLFPREPVLLFETLPDDLVQQLIDSEELRDVAESKCAIDLQLEDGFEALAYLPAELAGLPIEAFLIADPAGQELAILVDAEACIPIE